MKSIIYKASIMLLLIGTLTACSSNSSEIDNSLKEDLYDSDEDKD